MVSRGLLQAGGILLLSLAVSATASAQYGGGGSGGSGMGGSGSSSSGYGSGGYGGNGKAIGIGVGAAAAAAVGVVLFVRHRHTKEKAAEAKASVIGCTHSEINGISLQNENDAQTYMIISSGTQLQVGQRVELTGLVTDQGPGTRTFRVQGPIRNFGTCDATAAALGPKATAQAN